MKTRWIIGGLCLAVALGLILAGCAADKPASSALPEASIAVTGLPNGDLTATMRDVRALRTYDGKVEGADSAGNPVVYHIKGGYFSDLLEKNGYSQSNLAGIRVIATDGYSIEVSEEILRARDVVIAYEMDGKPLDEKNAPFRAFIPGERAMYWVRMVSEIKVLPAADPEGVSGVYVLESLYSVADFQDYEFAGTNHRVLDTRKILGDHPGDKGDAVIMVAADGLVKNETLENFYKGVVRVAGEGSPEFMSKTLPRGMFVKNLSLFKYGGNAFWFASANKAKALDEVAKSCSLVAADSRTLRFADGTSRTIASSELSAWTLGFEGGKAFVQKQGAQEKYWNLAEIRNN